MATLYVAEYRGLGLVQADGSNANYAYKIPAGAPEEPPVAEQTVAIGGTTAASSSFNQNTYLIRVHTDAICSIAIGSGTPTATTSKKRMAANQTEYFAVQPGWKIAVIANT